MSGSEYCSEEGYFQHVINFMLYVNRDIISTIWYFLNSEEEFDFNPEQLYVLTEIPRFKISQLEKSKTYLCDPTLPVFCYLTTLWIPKTT